jgi:prepilin-type N-terminal cleavage/methylation domain-containing protein
MKPGINMLRFEKRIMNAGGFTLIELIIVMAIACIFLALAMPSFLDFTRNVRAGSMMGSLTSDIQLARSESVKRNARVLFCARATVTSSACIGAPTTAAWSNGWLVCHDTNADGACDATTATDPNPIKIQGAPPAPLTVVGPAATLVMFPVGSASASSTFTLTGGNATVRTATIAPSGSVVITKYESAS